MSQAALFWNPRFAGEQYAYGSAPNDFLKAQAGRLAAGSRVLSLGEGEGRNAIHLAHALGVPRPRVALLSAVETVTPRLVSTLDAAALCKMADRGQISGAELDGPLAFDNAISADAARIKHISSPVAGDADILVTPDLESGNMLAKQLEYLAGASSCGVVLGARVPIALTSRADGATSRMASTALAALHALARSA